MLLRRGFLMIHRGDDLSFSERLREAERFHMGTGSVHETLRQLAADLDREKIDYAIIGGMALNAHGYRRETIDVDVLVRPEGLERFRDELVGRGYRPKFEGAKKEFRNTTTNIPVEFITTGEFPGDGKPKPVAFPDPAAKSIDAEGIRVIDLATLIELKLASGMTQPSRLRDLADVQDLIRTLRLTCKFIDQLHPYVHESFDALCSNLDGSDTDTKSD